MDPYNAWAYRNKGILMLEKKDYSNAERLLRQSLDMDPFVDKINFYLGIAQQKNGNASKACESFRKSESQGEGMVSSDLMKGCK